jgi:hypothetical protein
MMARCAGFRFTRIGLQAQEPVLNVSLGMGGDVGAFALSPHHQVFGSEFVDGLAHSALADLETRGQFLFAGNHIAGLPFALLAGCAESDF